MADGPRRIRRGEWITGTGGRALIIVVCLDGFVEVGIGGHPGLVAVLAGTAGAAVVVRVNRARSAQRGRPAAAPWAT